MDPSDPPHRSERDDHPHRPHRPERDAAIYASMPTLREQPLPQYHGELLSKIWEDEASQMDGHPTPPDIDFCQTMLDKQSAFLSLIDQCHVDMGGRYDRVRLEVQNRIRSGIAEVKAFDDSIEAFLKGIDEAIEKLARGDVGLQRWEPPSVVNPDYIKHLRSLKVPCLTAQSDTPSLLLHGLGELTTQSEARGCIDEIYKKQVTYLCNAAGSGKTRLLLEGLTLHWGLFFTLEKDDWGVGSHDFSEALANLQSERFSDVVHGSLGLANSDSQDRLRTNQQIVRRRVQSVFLARLLVFDRFLQHVPETMTEQEENVYRLRWLILQVDPCILPERNGSDIFLSLTRLILESSLSKPAVIQDIDTRLQAHIEALFPTPPPVSEASATATPDAPPVPQRAPRFPRFYAVIDEAQNAAELYPHAFRASAPQGQTATTGSRQQVSNADRPLLREILYVIMEKMRGRSFYPIPTGTSISQDNFLHAIQSHVAKDVSQVVKRYTGGVHTAKNAEEFAQRMLPATYLECESGRRLLERMFTWLRGRFRLMARFLAYLLSDGIRSPHRLLNAFVYAYTKGYEPSDADDLTEYEPELQVYVSSDSAEQINFDRLQKDAAKLMRVVNTVRPLVLHFLMKSTMKTIVPSAKSPELVELGFARYAERDRPNATSSNPSNSAHAVIDEPIMILRLATWFDTDPKLRGEYSAYQFFASDFKTNTTDDNGWENYVSYCLIQLFSRSPAYRLRDIFDEVKTPAGDFAGLLDQTAEIVRVIRPDGTPVLLDKSAPRVAILRDGRLINTSFTSNDIPHPRIPGVHLGDTVRNNPLAKSPEDKLKRDYEHTLLWLSDTTTPIFRPDTNLGPDLIVILRLADGHLCWLVVQCKLVSPASSTFKVRSSDLQSAFLSTMPENFFISANRKERNENEHKKNRRALKRLQELPNRTKLAGEFSCIRAIAIFPGNCDDLSKYAETDQNSHPLVKLNFDCLKKHMDVLYPKGTLAAHESEKKEKAANDAAIKAAEERRKRSGEKEDSEGEEEERNQSVLDADNMVIDDSAFALYETASVAEAPAPSESAYTVDGHTAGSDYTIDDGDVTLHQQSYNYPSAVHPTDTPGAGPSWAAAGPPMAPQQSAHQSESGLLAIPSPFRTRSTRSKRSAATMSEDEDHTKSSVGNAPKRRRKH